MIVVDANVLIAFAMEGAETAAARAAATKESWCAPLLWRSEVRATLLKLLRAKVLSSREVEAAFNGLENLLRSREHPVNDYKVLQFAINSQASPYDCEYIVLACDFNQRLLTLDRALTAHFPKIAVHLHDYLKE